MKDIRELSQEIAKIYGAQSLEAAEEAINKFVYGVWGEALEEVANIIDWYENTVSPPLHELMDKRKHLASNLFFVSAMVGQAGKVYRSYYAKRKIDFSSRTIANIEEFGAVGKAEHQAMVDTAALRLKEVEAESSYEKGKFLVMSANKVLDSMQQEIADLRREEEKSRAL